MAGELLDPIPPGGILYEEFMLPLGISINGLAREIHVPPKRISEIVNGKRAITGAATGLLPVPRRRSSRPSRGVAAPRGQVTAFERWAEGAALWHLAVPLNEAERCARALLARWPEIDGR